MRHWDDLNVARAGRILATETLDHAWRCCRSASCASALLDYGLNVLFVVCCVTWQYIVIVQQTLGVVALFVVDKDEIRFLEV
jgi:hypothetical protein